MFIKGFTLISVALHLCLAFGSTLHAARSGLDDMTLGVRSAQKSVDAYDGSILRGLSVMNAVYNIHGKMDKSYAACNELQFQSENDWEEMRESFLDLKSATIDMLGTVKKKATDIDSAGVKFVTNSMIHMFLQESRAYQNMIMDKIPSDNATELKPHLSDMDNAFLSNVVVLN